jgi:hypothetical protein
MLEAREAEAKKKAEREAAEKLQNEFQNNASFIDRAEIKLDDDAQENSEAKDVEESSEKEDSDNDKNSDN